MPRRIVLLAFVLVVLFGLIALPVLAREISSAVTEDSLQSPSYPAAQITFTPVATIYLPAVLRAPNTLEITGLAYSGDDEIVTITNRGPGSQSMDGWQIISVTGSQTYNFPGGINLPADQSVRVHSGPAAINNPPTDLLWTTAYIWNNAGDKAELRDDQGILRDTVCYGNGCP